VKYIAVAAANIHTQTNRRLVIIKTIWVKGGQ